eukprot:scaffold713_cov131-Cylindrotheca_fusiformis.AAC.19
MAMLGQTANHCETVASADIYANFSNNNDSHFPDDMFGLEELAEVDDLLTELGMNSQTSDDYSGPVKEEHNPHNTSFQSSIPSTRIPDYGRSVSPSGGPLSTMTAAAMTTTTNPPWLGNSVVRSVSVDQVSAPPMSVPKKPAPNQYITPKASYSQPIAVPMAAVSPERHATQAASTLKRKHSDFDSEKNLSAEEMEERRERNRTHAKKSRQRKKVLTGMLQASVEDLKRENEKLRDEINAMMGPQQATTIMAQKKEQNRERFIAALMDPQNRVLSSSGMAFMKKLRKCVPQDS